MPEPGRGKGPIRNDMEISHVSGGNSYAISVEAGRRGTQDEEEGAWGHIILMIRSRKSAL